MKELCFRGRRLPRYDDAAPFVQAPRLLARAALAEGKQVQFRPPWLFLRGYTPEATHLRVATEPIETYSQEYILDLVVVTDANILTEVDVTTGLKDAGVLMVNSPTPVPVNIRARKAVADLGAIAKKFRVDLSLPLAAAAAALSRVVGQEALTKLVETETRGTNRRKCVQALEAARQVVTISAR